MTRWYGALVGKIEKLPSLPHVYLELNNALTDMKVEVREVARILQRDTAMCAKLLQLVNSSFFGVRRRISSIEDAVVYLGFDIIKYLVLSAEIFRWAEKLPLFDGFSIEAVREHALLTASITTSILPDKQQQDEVFMAAILHDVGKLILAMARPDHLNTVLAGMRRTGRPMHVVEQELSGVTHAEIGGICWAYGVFPTPSSRQWPTIMRLPGCRSAASMCWEPCISLMVWQMSR